MTVMVGMTPFPCYLSFIDMSLYICGLHNAANHKHERITAGFASLS